MLMYIVIGILLTIGIGVWLRTHGKVNRAVIEARAKALEEEAKIVNQKAEERVKEALRKAQDDIQKDL